MLACARIGAIHSVVFGGFAANELAIRIEDTQPKLICRRPAASSQPVVPYKPLLDKPSTLVRKAGRLHHRAASAARPRLSQAATTIGATLWRAQSRGKSARCEPWPPPTRSISSTRPAPPAAEGRGPRHRRPHGRAQMVDAKSLRRLARANLLGASDIGWVVGHSYIVYAPLLHGATTIFYEGKPVGRPTPARSGA